MMIMLISSSLHLQLLKLYPTITVNDVVAVRKMGSRRGGSRGVKSVGGASSSASPTEQAKSPFLLVTLVSNTLANGIVVVKARHRKLHSSALNVDHLKKARMPLTLPSFLVGIHEFLPSDLYNLRRMVRDESKKRGFTTFIKEGQVYVKKKKEDIATLISTPEDLKNYLSSLELLR
uniref:Uncharacterized protein n=1 Tax=Bracon brevicornis TaxID=1563983 RepID=A0A6V7LC95_9HYME